jgi:tetratricopeptide (TPR) repeat protein
MLLKNYVKPLSVMGLILLTAACSRLPGRLPEKTMEPPADAALQDKFNRAVQLMQQQKYDQAEPLLRQLTQAAPDRAAPYGNLGILYAKAERWKDAQPLLERSVKLDPGNPALWTELGVVYRQNGMLDAAQTAYQRALQINSNYPLAHLDIGILYDLYLQKPQQALEHYRRYQALKRGEDKQVALWITDLEKRVNSASGITK